MRIYQIDAFADEVFQGNPAAVCVLDKWPKDQFMQQIASENNLSETAFIVEEAEGFRIRWFTPLVEVDLCGHATLAAAHVFFEHLAYNKKQICFNSRSGILRVIRLEKGYQMDFPAGSIVEAKIPDDLLKSLNVPPIACYRCDDYFLVYESEHDIAKLTPDFGLMGKVKSRGVICTAPGEKHDFVSRFFTPQCGIDEDPVTGSAHTNMAPYWSRVLGKDKLTARQISLRGGNLLCEVKGDRVLISGQAQTYLIGDLQF